MSVIDINDIHLLTQVVEEVQILHDMGLAHGDISINNVYLMEEINSHVSIPSHI